MDHFGLTGTDVWRAELFACNHDPHTFNIWAAISSYLSTRGLQTEQDASHFSLTFPSRYVAADSASDLSHMQLLATWMKHNVGKLLAVLLACYCFDRHRRRP